MERVGEGARSHAVRLVRFLVRNFVVAHGRHRIINTLLCSGMYNNVQHTFVNTTLLSISREWANKIFRSAFDVVPMQDAHTVA